MCTTLFRVVFQPFTSDYVGQMAHFEIGEHGFETIAIGTCREHSDFCRPIGLKLCVTHHVVLFIIERIKNFHSIETAYSLYPDIVDRAVESYNTPIGGFMCYNRA